MNDVATLASFKGTKSVAGPVVARYIAPDGPPVPVLQIVALLDGAELQGPLLVAYRID